MPYAYLQMPIGWNGLGMPTIMCVYIPIGRDYFKARGVKKVSSTLTIYGTESFLRPLVLKNLPNGYVYTHNSGHAQLLA